jgi:hypothetical protein
VPHPSQRLEPSRPGFHASKIWGWASQESAWWESHLNTGCNHQPSMPRSTLALPIVAAPTGMELRSLSAEEECLWLPFMCRCFGLLHLPMAAPVCSCSPHCSPLLEVAQVPNSTHRSSYHRLRVGSSLHVVSRCGLHMVAPKVVPSLALVMPAPSMVPPVRVILYYISY